MLYAETGLFEGRRLSFENVEVPDVNADVARKNNEAKKKSTNPRPKLK